MSESEVATVRTVPAGTDPGLAARLGAKVRQWKDAAATAQKERDGLKAELDALRARPVDPTAAELRAQLREIKHRAEFDRAAETAGAKTVTQKADLWKLSGYQPETDEPDPQAIADMIKTQKTERDYLFRAAPEPGAAAPPLLKPGAAAGRGSTDPDQGLYTVTRAQARDPLFMRDNAAKIAKAQTENRFVLEDRTLIL